MRDYKNNKTAQEIAKKYADIIDLQRPQSQASLVKHPRMTLQNRAKIFSPFAALRGYDDQLADEKQRSEHTVKKTLTEESAAVLSDTLLRIKKGSFVTVCYFEEDIAYPETQPVGNYISLSGQVDAVDCTMRTLKIGTTVVLFDDIYEIELKPE